MPGSIDEHGAVCVCKGQVCVHGCARWLGIVCMGVQGCVRGWGVCAWVCKEAYVRMGVQGVGGGVQGGMGVRGCQRVHRCARG